MVPSPPLPNIFNRLARRFRGTSWGMVQGTVKENAALFGSALCILPSPFTTTIVNLVVVGIGIPQMIVPLCSHPIASHCGPVPTQGSSNHKMWGLLAWGSSSTNGLRHCPAPCCSWGLWLPGLSGYLSLPSMLRSGRRRRAQEGPPAEEGLGGKQTS